MSKLEFSAGMTKAHNAKLVKWGGGGCPVMSWVKVRPRYRGSSRGDFRIVSASAGDLAWYHDGGDDDIVAYEIVT